MVTEAHFRDYKSLQELEDAIQEFSKISDDHNVKIVLSKRFVNKCASDPFGQIGRIGYVKSDKATP